MKLPFIQFFTSCNYSWIYINPFHIIHLFIFAFLFFFSLSFNPLSHPLIFSFLFFFSFFFPLFFLSLFLSSPCKLNCCALFAVFPSCQSTQAQFSRLSISLALLLIGQYHLWFPLFIKSISCTRFFIFFSFIFVSWRLITLQYCSGFCHTLTWISHGFTCIPHPDSSSHLPLYPIPLGLTSAPSLIL